MVDFEKELYIAKEGWRLWQKLKRKYSITDMIGLILFPSADMTVNREAAALLPDYMEHRRLQKLVAVTDRRETVNILENIPYGNVFLEKISNYEMICLLSCYRLICFCSNVVVVSLEEPFGNYLAVCDGRTDMRSYVWLSVYRDNGIKGLKERIRMAVDAFVQEHQGESAVIYGCTGYARQIYLLMQEKGVYIEAFIDNDKKKAGKKYLGVDIFLPKRYLLSCEKKKHVIVCSAYGREMLDSLHDMGYGSENILYIDLDGRTEEECIEITESKMEFVRKGIECYRRLQSEYGKGTVLLIAPEASGDVFLALAYLCDWNMLHHMSDYVLVGAKSNFIDIAKLYDLDERTKLVTIEERDSLLAAYMFMGERLNVKPLSGWSLRIRNSFVGKPDKPFLFKDAFRYETYGLMKEAEPKYPQRKNKAGENRLQCMRKGKTIIIAPYAYSSQKPMIATEVWEEIVETLCKKGYMVRTVGYGKGEPPIKGTQRLQFSYREACDILESAGGFIAARSGLCDIVHMAECRQLIIYGKNIRNEYSNIFFSLKRNYPDFKGDEIIYDDFERQDFIRYVTNYF